MGFLRALMALVLVAGVGLGGFLWITAPADLSAETAAALDAATPDATRGQRIFLAAGCSSCHAAPGAEGEERLVLAGGMPFATAFGTFVAPNISPGQAGIGGWSLHDLARALTLGVSPEGQHYYPALPYTAYIHMKPNDIADLKAYLDTLPVSDVPSQPHEVGFPFNIRRSLGGWKWLFLNDDWVLPEAPEDGRYLVEALGHCGECHTPRNALGGTERGQWLAGAPNPDGKGEVPGITPATLDWSEEDIAYYLETGFTPDFDSVGGHMAYIVANYGQLAPEDRAAVAAYLKAVPARP
mgnify:CR=1 FL=1